MLKQIGDKETNVCFSADPKRVRLMGITKHLVLGENTCKKKGRKHFKCSEWQRMAGIERERKVDR